jgi:hypothetical protein
MPTTHGASFKNASAQGISLTAINGCTHTRRVDRQGEEHAKTFANEVRKLRRQPHGSQMNFREQQGDDLRTQQRFIAHPAQCASLASTGESSGPGLEKLKRKEKS